MAKKGLSEPFTVCFVPSDAKDGGTGFRPNEPIPLRLQGLDPRVVEFVRLLGRETARAVIARSLREAEARKGSKGHED